MFSNSTQSIPISSPHLGINTTEGDNPQYAKYLENIVISDNNSSEVRCGTYLIKKHDFNVDRIFRNQISVMSHLSNDGKSEKLIYQNYLSKIPYVDFVDHVLLEEIDENNTKLTIDVSSLIGEQKVFLKNRFEENRFVYINQNSISEGQDISNLIINENSIEFALNYSIDFFDNEEIYLDDGLPEPVIDRIENRFELWWERGSVYRLKNNNFERLIEDLNPDVIVSHLNYLGMLIIANGTDPLMIYDGNILREYKGRYAFHQTQDSTNADNIITCHVHKEFKLKLDQSFHNGSILLNHLGETIGTVTNIVYNLTGTKYKITITLDNIDADRDVSNLYLEESLPKFSYITVANNRLWATGEDRNKYNEYRNENKSMFVYYAAKTKSIYDWFDSKNLDIGFIDLSTNIAQPDNIEAIVPYQNNLLFLGRENIQVYSGYDPKINKLEKDDLKLPDFKFEKTFNIGIFQKNLWVEMPNDIIFFSKYGLVSLSSINVYQQLAVSFNFSNPISDYINRQLENVNTDRDYREMSLFLYSYGRFIGLKLNYNCFIYQIRQKGIWTIFSGDFHRCKSFHYDSVDKNLYLGNGEGSLLCYADKQKNLSFKDYLSGQISWKIHLPWLYTKNTWCNEEISIACRSLKELDVKIDVYVDYKDTDRFEEIIEVKQCSLIYNYNKIDDDCYYYDNESFPHELYRFESDAIMIVISGLSEEQFIFDKLFLRGGFVDGSN